MAWTAPPTFVAGAVLTAAQMNGISGDLNALTNGRRLGTVTLDGSYSVSSSTLGGAANIFASSITWTAVAATEYRIELIVPFLETGVTQGSTIYTDITDTSTNGAISVGRTGSGNGTSAAFGTITQTVYWTPGAGSKSVNARAFHTIAAGTLYGRSGFEIAPIRLSVFGPVSTNA
jgi:hypothetical protein